MAKSVSISEVPVDDSPSRCRTWSTSAYSAAPFGSDAPQSSSFSTGSGIECGSVDPRPLRGQQRLSGNQSFFPVRSERQDGRWRLVTRGKQKPNIVGRTWIEKHLERWKLKDWFYGCVHMRTSRLLFVFFVGYVLSVMCFAVVYFFIDLTDLCGLGLNGGFRAAFFFSLETHSTIGYGAPDANFNECTPMLFALLSQAFVALVGDATLIGLLFARLSRGTKRAVSVIFSNRAVIVEHDGEQYLLFQVFDKRRDVMVEANIRAFCYIHHEFGGRQFPLNRALRLTHPSPDDGSVLLSCSPTLAIHRLDATSPLVAAASLAGFSMKQGKIDAHELVEALQCLPHFEILVEVNGTENITTAQVQARWSFLLDEVDVQEIDRHWETPQVSIQDGLAHVHRTAVNEWRNSACPTGMPGQLAQALAFYLPVAFDPPSVDGS